MALALLSIVFAIDLGLFVLVFLVVRSRRIRPGMMVAIIAGAVGAYLASLILLIFISSHL